MVRSVGLLLIGLGLYAATPQEYLFSYRCVTMHGRLHNESIRLVPAMRLGLCRDPLALPLQHTDPDDSLERVVTDTLLAHRAQIRSYQHFANHALRDEQTILTIPPTRIRLQPHDEAPLLWLCR